MLEFKRSNATGNREGLAQGPYVVARVGFEPPTFLAQVTEPTTEPPHHAINIILLRSLCIIK